MNYDLVKTVPGEIAYNVDQALPYGDIPSSMLMAKYEETNLDAEDAYDNYARNALCDWTPDTNKFEHEEARGGVNRRSGKLQLQYYGHRGDADTVFRPESFDGFAGEEFRDPRGIATEPDMKEMRKQHEARTRFVNFTADHDDSITGGGRSEAKVMADRQTMFRRTRDTLKVFSTQVDGRVEGRNVVHKHSTVANKQLRAVSYGDHMTDHTMTPVRKANVISKQVLADMQAYRDETLDAEFSVAKYSQLRRGKAINKHKVVANAQHSQDAELFDGDDTKQYRAVGILMSNIIRGKATAHTNVKSSDIEFSEARQTVSAKTAPFAKDLAYILRSMTQDADTTDSDKTVMSKTAKQQIGHQSRQIVYNHLKPIQHLNAEMMFKSVKPGADIRKIKDLVITDADVPALRETLRSNTRAVARRQLAGAKLMTTDDTDKADSGKTYNYRQALKANGDRRIRSASGEDYASESDNTQMRRMNHENYQSATVDNTVEDMRFADNAAKERRSRGLGGKYMNRFIDRDAREGEIAFENKD